MELSSSHALFSPSASRFGHSCSLISAHDSAWSTELAVLFSGVKRRDAVDEIDESQPGDDVYVATNDLFVLDIEGQRWFTPKANDSPSPRAFVASATTGKTIWLFGGHVLHTDSSSSSGSAKKKTRVFYGDLWSLDTDSWTFSLEWSQAQTADSKGPSKRDMASLTSVGGGKLVLFGGRSEAGRSLSDLWVFDIHEKVWSQLKPPLPHPPPRKLHAAVSIGGGRMLIYGGERDLGGPFDDLWTLRGLDMEESSPVRWTPIRLKPSPGPRFGHTLSFLSFSSSSSSSPPSAWKPRADRSEEGTREQTAFVLLWGGGLNLADAWCLDLSSFKWSKAEIKQPCPTARLCHTLLPLSPPPSTSQGATQGATQGANLGAEESAGVPSSASFRLLLVGGRGNQGLIGGGEAAWVITAMISLHQNEPSEESSSVISSVFGSAATPVNLFRSLLTFPPLLSVPKPSAAAPKADHQHESKTEPSSSHQRTTEEILTPLEPEEVSQLDKVMESDSGSDLRQLLDRVACFSASKQLPPLSVLSLAPDDFKFGSLALLLEKVKAKRATNRRDAAKTALQGTGGEIPLEHFLQRIEQLSYKPLPTDCSSLTIGEIKALLNELSLLSLS